MNFPHYPFWDRLLPSAQPALREAGGAWQDRPGADPGVIESDIGPRLDRLPWDRFHTLVVVALGITWILDGLEVTLTGSLAGALEQSRTLQFTTFDIGLTGSAYLVGAVLGAIFFGWLTDRLGRKKLFLVTLGVYLGATALTSLSWSFASFAVFRALTGFGIGGECAAMNSATKMLRQRVMRLSDLNTIEVCSPLVWQAVANAIMLLT